MLSHNMTQFTHLHVHSHYSILDGMSKVPDIVDKCIKNGMYSVALTDHGVMYGVKEFHDYVGKINGKTKDAIKEQECIASDEKASEEERTAAREKADELKKKIFKPIFGVEAYCARRSLQDKDASIKSTDPETGRASVLDRSGWHLILLAKNRTGYFNLCKMVSISWIDGFYGKPRIDKSLLEKYHEGVICCSACLGGEIPQLIMARKMDEAEKSVRWFKEIFGDDYYLEIQRHPTSALDPAYDVWTRQQEVNPFILELAEKTGVKVICTNDSHFLDKDHADAHERLLCLSTGKVMSDTDRLHYTKQEWLKTPDEMAELFSDLPETMANTMEIADKVENINLNSDPIMPKFPIPEDFGTEEEYRKRLTEKDLFDEFTQDEKHQVVMDEEAAKKKIKKLGGYDKLYRIKLEADYLAKLTWEGAHKRYGEELNQAQIDQITFELHIMKTMGFPGYFLIVMDFIRAAREELDVWVGPGRGSAAGSVVAYCLGITDIDPMKYDLLFERFLNPDRISLPDIDTDFADDGRQKVIEWVTEKYGATAVAHIITFGTMATKSSVSDVGRVQDVPLSTVKQMTGLIPDKFSDDLADPKTKKVPKVNLKNCFKYVPELQMALNGPDPNVSSMLRYAGELEGTVRQTGVHACGIIIGADDLKKFAPITVVEDKQSGFKMQATQYDGHYVESVGLIKMDFLGLINLRIMKEAVKNIKAHTGEEIDIFKVPIDDPDVYKLYAEGRTVGIFQFESAGMQKYLKELQPTVFEDLIAMNALYRPGPMDYIPQFINRKQGREPITYDIPCMEKYLKDTYGVTVYQEQVMLLSRLLANFTRGESDKLRKAMGKKQIAVLNELKPKFINQGSANGHPVDKLEKIWADWEKFASYAFNKSHATCYSWVSYQTAYLKCHYPAEYMAGLLTCNRDAISEVSKFMDECKNMGLKVLGPDVNNSHLNFSVSHDGAVVFGLGGVKGVGEGAVIAIVGERDGCVELSRRDADGRIIHSRVLPLLGDAYGVSAHDIDSMLNTGEGFSKAVKDKFGQDVKLTWHDGHGPFNSIFDFVERVDLSACNRKTIESLAMAGSFDSLGDIKREQFFCQNLDGLAGSEILVRYGNNFQNDKKNGQASLFGDILDSVIARPALPEIVNEWSDLDRLNREKEVVGIYISSHPLAKYSFEFKCLVNTKSTEMTDDNLPNLDGKTFVVAGIASVKKTGMSKRNQPYMIGLLEDMYGKCEIPLFGDDYVKYSPYFAHDAFICVTGKVDHGRFGGPQLRRSIIKIEFLADVLKHGMVKNVIFTVDIKRLHDQVINLFGDVLQPNKRKQTAIPVDAPPVVPVKFHIVDRERRIDLPMTSQTYSVELGPKLMKFIDDTEGAVEMSVTM